MAFRRVLKTTALTGSFIGAVYFRPEIRTHSFNFWHKLRGTDNEVKRGIYYQREGLFDDITSSVDLKSPFTVVFDVKNISKQPVTWQYHGNMTVYDKYRHKSITMDFVNGEPTGVVKTGFCPVPRAH